MPPRTDASGAKLANADVVVPRWWLSEPLRRVAIRKKLWETLGGQLGYVEHIVRFVVDPPDGPYRDGGMTEALNDAEFAVVRCTALVRPRPLHEQGEVH